MGVILKSPHDKHPRKYKTWSREKRNKIRYDPLRGDRKEVANTWRKREQAWQGVVPSLTLKPSKDGGNPPQSVGALERGLQPANQGRLQLTLPWRPGLCEGGRGELADSSFSWTLSYELLFLEAQVVFFCFTI